MTENNGISRLRNLLRGAHRSEAVDLDGLLLGGMAATLAGLQAVGGGGDVARVELAEGVVLEFGPSTIKTPAWMVPHAELSYADLVAHGFEWAVPTR